MTVYLVGAGPGDPKLITVRGAELLRAAEVVVHDRLVSAELLAVASPTAELVDVGKAPGCAPVPQDAINDLLIALGRTDRAVVRLKGGDGFVFGRGGEEAAALQAAGVDCEIVPGVSSAIGAPAAAGIPLTMRHQVASVTVVTGHQSPDSVEEPRWDAIAATGGTIVILMGARRIAEIAQRLIAGGLPGDTPVAAIGSATTVGQSEVRATLADIGSHRIEAPSTIVVGAVAALDLRSSGYGLAAFAADGASTG